MGENLRIMKQSISDYQRDKNDKNALWRSRLPFSQNVAHEILGEISDLVPELATRGRITRSQGSVEEYPHVQYRPIEYVTISKNS